MQKVCLLAMFLLTPVVWADIIRLQDGSQVEGQVRKSADGWTVIQSDGKVLNVPADNVKGVEVGGKDTSPLQAEGKLFSLRKAVENLSDIPTIIDRYQRFIEQNKNTPIVAEAEKDLTIWRDRQARNLIHIGDKWVTSQQQQELIGKSQQLAEQGRQLLKQGRIREASTLLDESLTYNPRNISSLYMTGLIQYRQNQLPQARKNFEAVNAIIPDHAPTLNNLGVVLSRQNQLPGALGYYDQAMNASPGNKDILNNVAEALNALARDQQDSQIVRRAQRRFDEQDQKLQVQMRPYGWFRWGATWVTQADMDRLREAENQIKAKLDALSAEFDQNDTKARQLVKAIDNNNRQLHNIEATLWYQDTDGRWWRGPYPSIYYELQRDNDQLAADRNEVVARQEAIRRTAAEVQQKLPVPKYTGIQHLIDIEGTPLILPMTQPTTRP